MRRIHVSLVLILIWCSAADFPKDRTPEPHQNSEARVDLLLKRNNQLAETINELAVERFLLNEHRGERWILGVQSSSLEVEKLTDGRRMVILIPFQDASDGLAMFVRAYDVMVLRSADKQVKAGVLSDATETYRLLQKYAPSSFYPREISQRLECVGRLKEGPLSARVMAEFESLKPNDEPFSFLARMGTGKPRVMANLLRADLSDAEEGQ